MEPLVQLRGLTGRRLNESAACSIHQLRGSRAIFVCVVYIGRSFSLILCSLIYRRFVLV